MNDPRPKPTEEDGRRALRDHVVDLALAARERLVDRLDDADGVAALLEDERVTRYPTTLSRDATALGPGEFAWAESLGMHPRDGFRLHVHPLLQGRDLVAAAAYHLVRVNYGDIAGTDDAEAFGAALLGLDIDAYYDLLCQMSDRLAAAAGSVES